jgi:very-short-patch-repair endonuclease
MKWRDNLYVAWEIFSPEYLRPDEKPEMETEYRFDPQRRWRADFRVGQVLIEIDGAVYAEGRHTRGAGFTADCEKLNRAVELGYRVLRFTTGMLAQDPDAVIQQIVNVWRLNNG